MQASKEAYIFIDRREFTLKTIAYYNAAKILKSNRIKRKSLIATSFFTILVVPVLLSSTAALALTPTTIAKQEEFLLKDLIILYCLNNIAIKKASAHAN